MINHETYVKVVTHNVEKILKADLEDLERIKRVHLATVRNMDKRLNDTERPLSADLVPDYILNRDLSKELGKITRKCINVLKGTKYYDHVLDQKALNKLWDDYWRRTHYE